MALDTAKDAPHPLRTALSLMLSHQASQQTGQVCTCHSDHQSYSECNKHHSVRSLWLLLYLTLWTFARQLLFGAHKPETVIGQVGGKISFVLLVCPQDIPWRATSPE
eukprot:6373770-Amphidinium_carterae.1